MQYTNLLVFAGLIAVTYFLLVRPQLARQRQQATLVASLSVDDQVLTASGMYGTIRTIEGDEVEVEIAEGVLVRMVKAAIIGKRGD